jgi:uroporphyrinogen decarboxylase
LQRWGKVTKESKISKVIREVLRSGTPEEVESRVKELIDKVAPGGGYCVGSGNYVPDWAQFKNYMAMRDVTLKHGVYPIHID